MSVRLAIPVHFASLTIHVEKGRRWNAVEHMLLYAVSQTPRSASELAADSNIELRLVIEVMIRLMRAGWIELESSRAGLKFQSTSAGKAVVERDELPVITSPRRRKASFVIELATGTVFRARDLTLYNKHEYTKLKESNVILELPPVEVESTLRQDEIIYTLLDEDEECKHVEAVPGRFSEKFAIVSVVGGTIEGLPSKASARLKNKILLAAQHLDDGKVSRVEEKDEPQNEFKDLLRIRFDTKDFIVGAREHGELLKFHLKKARSRVIIHSTFIDPERFRALVPLFHDAAKRGVRIDILWGKNDGGDDLSPMQQTIAKCRSMLVGDDIRERIKIHSFSTSSHAKILVVDNEKGKMIAVIGSCNWLSSAFEATEASVRLEHPSIVSQILGHLGKMSAGPGLDWNSLATDLALRATSLKSAPFPSGGISVDVRLVFGAEHSHFVRMARDEAQTRIVVTSHRFSHNAENAILRPTTAAVKASDVSVRLFFGQFDGDGAGAVAAAIAEKARSNGIRHEHVQHPNLHAKVLAWDNDAVVVTSQNWLSADPNDDDMYSEIGIYMKGTNLATELLHVLSTTMTSHQ